MSLEALTLDELHRIEGGWDDWFGGSGSYYWNCFSGGFSGGAAIGAPVGAASGAIGGMIAAGSSGYGLPYVLQAGQAGAVVGSAIGAGVGGLIGGAIGLGTCYVPTPSVSSTISYTSYYDPDTGNWQPMP